MINYVKYFFKNQRTIHGKHNLVPCRTSVFKVLEATSLRGSVQPADRLTGWPVRLRFVGYLDGLQNLYKGQVGGGRY
jgi:hypothetical protein